MNWSPQVPSIWLGLLPLTVSFSFQKTEADIQALRILVEMFKNSSISMFAYTSASQGRPEALEFLLQNGLPREKIRNSYTFAIGGGNLEALEYLMNREPLSRRELAKVRPSLSSLRFFTISHRWSPSRFKDPHPRLHLASCWSRNNSPGAISTSPNSSIASSTSEGSISFPGCGSASQSTTSRMWVP